MMSESTMTQEAGIYIHIPFCKQACHYCNFHFSTSLHYKPDLIKAICREIEIKSSILPTYSIRSIYFGGGTPSLLDESELSQLMEAIHKNFSVNDNAEITLEANPDDINPSSLLIFNSSGINRLSIGVQSIIDEHLIWMNRSHNATQAFQAIEASQDAGFTNLNIDIIFGVPGMTAQHIKQFITYICDSNIPHVSAYNLTVEEQTLLNKKIKNGLVKLPEEEQSVSAYLLIHKLLVQSNYNHYEVSNYALPGFESRHNSSYWSGHPYYGFGPAAHSFYDNIRSWNISNNQKYIRAVNEGNIPQESEQLTDDICFNEWLMTGLRTSKGISESNLLQFTSPQISHFKKQAFAYLKRGEMIYESGRYKLTPESWMISDHIIADLFVTRD